MSKVQGLVLRGRRLGVSDGREAQLLGVQLFRQRAGLSDRMRVQSLLDLVKCDDLIWQVLTTFFLVTSSSSMTPSMPRSGDTTRRCPGGITWIRCTANGG